MQSLWMWLSLTATHRRRCIRWGRRRSCGGWNLYPTHANDYVVRSQAPSGQPDYTGYNLCVATCGTALLRCGLACLVNEELTPFGQALCGLTCTTFYGFCVHDCKKAFNIP